MTEQEMIETLDDIWTFRKELTDKHLEAIEKAISALEKSREARERQIPKKIEFEMNLGDYTIGFVCGCGKRIIVNHDRGVIDNRNAPNYCSNCGQRLDWSE